jgi:preprotein translocase subunit SecG
MQVDELGNRLSEFRVPAGVVETFGRSRPWIIFFAVLCIGYALMCLFGGCMAMVTMSQMPAEMPSVLRWMPMFYIVFAAVSAVPAVLMFRYQASLGRVRRTPDEARLMEFAERHGQLWKLSGILVVVFFALMIVLTIVMVIAGMGDLTDGLDRLPRAR